MRLKVITSKISDASVAKATFSKRAIRLSKVAVEQYGIKTGDKIALCQDLEKPNDWYLIKNDTLDDVPAVTINKNGMATIDYPDAVDEIRKYFRINRMIFRLKLGGVVRSELGRAIILLTAPLAGLGDSKRKEEAHAS